MDTNNEEEVLSVEYGKQNLMVTSADSIEEHDHVTSAEVGASSENIIDNGSEAAASATLPKNLSTLDGGEFIPYFT